MEYKTYKNKYTIDGEYLGTCEGYDYYMHNGKVIRLYTEATFKGSDKIKTYSGDIVGAFIDAFDAWDTYESEEDFEDTLNFLDEASEYEIN